RFRPLPAHGSPNPCHTSTASSRQESMETTTTIATNQAAGRVGDLADARTVLLTTYRRDGTPVGTPVHIPSDDLGAYGRTFDPSGKLRRIRRDPHVTVAACTLRGRVM